MFFEGLCGEISIFCGRQTTDRQTTDDGQNRLLNPASRMRARGKNDAEGNFTDYVTPLVPRPHDSDLSMLTDQDRIRTTTGEEGS